MGKRFTLISAAAIALTLYTGNAVAGTTDTSRPRFVLAQQTAKNVFKRNITKASAYNASPLKVQPKAQGVMEAVLVNEDFSAMTSGTVEKPDTTKMLACEYEGYSDNGIYIDNSLTKDGTWFGSMVYSAGGALALKTYNPQILAYACTPIGDYSGDLTITLRVKANPALVNDGNGGYQKLTGSSIGIEVCTGGYEGLAAAKTDDESGRYEARIYEKDGWQEVTYTVKNYSANNDGYVCFYTEGSIVIDDVKIKAGSSFLANPVVEGITDFKKDNFTIAWQPTRKAFNYYVDLYTRKYLSDKDTTFVADFNDGTLPAGFETTSQTFVDKGTDNSKAIKLSNDDSFTVPTNGNDYKTAHFSLKVVDPTVDPTDPYAKYYVQGSILIDLKNADGWKNIGEYNASGFWNDADIVKLEEEYSKFATGGFTQLRLRVEDLNEGAYFVLDDVDVTAKPAFEYQIVGGDYYTDLKEDYCYTADTSNTSYTFTNLDPNTEYWYGVRAHYVSQFSTRSFTHALGVAAPETKEATDIDSRGSFTANWEAAPKATSYTANCYGVKYADEADEDYPILEEDFGTVDASVTTATNLADATPVNNEEMSSLDAYTKMPGWTGDYNTLVQGMIGAEGDYDYTYGHIYTPELCLDNADKCNLTLKLYGDANDQIGIKMNGTIYYLILPANGLADGTVTLPVTEARQKIGFFSYTSAPFVIDYIKIGQPLAKGAKTMTWLASGDTDANTLSYTFTGLDAYDFPYYGFDVTSHYQYDDNTSTSSLTPSNAMFVDLANGTSSGINELQNSSETKVVARYTADGQLVSAPVKGLNILKMSNGKIVKVIVK